MTEQPTADTSPLKRALVAIDRLQHRIEELEADHHEPIAIVGLGCRFPGGVRSPEEYWDFLLNSGDGIVEVPADRWDVDAYFDPDPDAPGRIASRHGGFIDDVDQFDPAFFGISPREAAAMDPQQRLVLEVAWEALEHAAIAPDQLGGSRTGVFVGVTSHDYAGLQLDARGPDGIDAYYASGIAGSTVSGRVSYVLGLRGPAVSIDTACSSSLVATHLAVQSLRTGDADLALAGGVNLILTPDNSIALSRYHMLAPDGRCKTFDAAADGFVRGEGCGIVALKRLRDADADGDPIIAVIRGSAVNQDGASSGLTAPNGPSQVDVIRAALADARLEPSEIAYVEAHGTGTSLGDPIEVQALSEAFGRNPETEPLAIGSVKTNVGHLEGVAGVAGLMKAALVAANGVIPPHRNLESLSPHIAWDQLGVAVPTVTTTLVGDVHRAGVSAFGFSGTNAHLIVETPPPPRPSEADSAARIVPIAAASPGALEPAVETLAADTLTQTPFGDVATTRAAGRANLAYRTAVVASSATEASSALQDVLDTGDVTRADDERRVGFLFTGQGAQWPGMARGLRSHEPTFRATFDSLVSRFDGLLADRLPAGAGLADLILGQEHGERLSQTVFTQPALFACEFALAELWESWGVRPAAMLGHSIGEIVAATRAGVFSTDDATALVAARGSLMQDLPAGGAMAAVMADAAEVESAVDEARSTVAVAAINGPRHVVVSGSSDAVAALVAPFEAAGTTVTPLRVSHAFHSPLMDPMLEAFVTIIDGLDLQPARRRVYSNLTGGPAGPEISTADYWVRHVREAVRFADGIGAMSAAGVDTFIEVGPHPVLSAMGQSIIPDEGLWLASLRRDHDDHRQVLAAAATAWRHGVPVDLAQVAAPRGGRRRALPRTPFERDRHWVETRPRPKAIASHPLLGTRRATPGAAVVFETEFSASSLALLGDHRVFGNAILPATGFLEAAHAGARTVDPSVIGLRDVMVREPLVADPDSVHMLTTIVTPGAGGLTVDVHSTTDREHWQHHLTASAITDAPAPRSDLALARERVSRSVTAVDHEARLTDAGLDFGPAVQTVQHLELGDDIAVSRIMIDPARRMRDAVVDPALLDGAIQPLAALTGGEATYLPVSVDRVAHHREAPTAGWSIVEITRRADNGETLSADVSLLDDDGVPISSITGIHFKKADPSALARARGVGEIDSWMYGVEFVPLPAIHPPGVDPIGDLGAVIDSTTDRVADLATDTGFDRCGSLLDGLEEMATAAIHRTLTTLGVGNHSGATIDPDVLGIADSYRPLFSQLMGFLVDDGALAVTDAGWSRAQHRDPEAAPSADDLCARYPDATGELRITERCAADLAAVLTGDADPLERLFPGGDTSDAEAMYATSPFSRYANGIMAETVGRLIEQLAAAGQRPRVIEVGGGTGGTTTHVLPAVTEHGAHYTFTDISPHFVRRAQQRFGDEIRRFSTFDVERDPATQDLETGAYDIVIATNVLHATADLATTFSNVRSLLAHGGHLVMLEMVVPTRYIAITFGLTPGWWAFTDHELRQDSLLLSREAWPGFLCDNGFDQVGVLPVETPRAIDELQGVFVARSAAPDTDTHALVIADAQHGAEIIAAFQAAGEAAELVEPAALTTLTVRPDTIIHAAALADHRDAAMTSALSTTQAAIARGARQLLFVTRGGQAVDTDANPSHAAIAGFARSVALEHPEIDVRVVDLDPAETAGFGRIVAEAHAKPEDLVAWRGDRRVAGRIVRAPAQPVADAYELTFDNRGSIDNLRVGRAERVDPGPGEVAIRVHATGLNFKDVLNVLGMYPGDPGPLGGECAGVITAIGDGVEGLHIGQPVAALGGGSFRSHAICDARFVVPKPQSLSFAEAAAVLIPAVTASFGLRHVGRLSEGDRVLVQAAAGGVGLAAAHLARHIGATVHVTAGSPAKRDYLRSLGFEHVHDSRSIDFVDEIRAATGGRGVDVVLNSIAGPAVGAGLDVLEPGGRFVELGKTDLVPAGDARRAGREYHVIDWTHEMETDPDLIRNHVLDAMRRIDRGDLPAPTITTFPFDAAADAFRYMASARHTGKVVLVQAAALTESTDGEGDEGLTGAYLITGGLRGLGLLTAEALVEDGVEALVLLGRRGPDADAEARIAAWRDAGVAVTVEQGDVADEAVVRRVIDTIAAGTIPLRGIVHSAGVLRDAAVQNLSADDLATVLAPKVRGADHLDRLTRDLPIRDFVIYSSIAGLLGSAGQANHAAANAYLDALAHRRRAHGLPAVSVAWGAWSEVGAAADLGIDRAAAAGAMGALRPDEGIAALRRVLERRDVHVGVNRGDLGVAMADRGNRTLYADLLAAVDVTSTSVTQAEPMLEGLHDAAPDRAREMLADHVLQQAARVLQLATDRVPDTVPLSELGLDSLMAVELRNLIGTGLGLDDPLSATLVFDYPTVQAVADHLFELVFGAAEPEPEAPAPGDAAGSLLDALENLSDEEFERRLAERKGSS